MNFPIIDVYGHPHYGDSVRYENYVELQEVTEKLEARVARLEDALRFILDECNWEESMQHVCGDNRIGAAARRALEEK